MNAGASLCCSAKERKKEEYLLASSLMTLRRRRKFARMLCLSKDRDESQEEGLPFGRSTAGCLCAQEEG